ncbi:MAG: hypothetical protein L0Z53_24320, partial [Acidobacteriales bacterium]|nr:hypothetical protein [Terriglobales bacterium]
EARTQEVVREEHQFITLLLNDPGALEDVTRNDETDTKTRAEHARKSIKGDAFFDPASTAIYPTFLKLAREGKSTLAGDVKNALTEQRTKDKKEMSAEEAKVLQNALGPPLGQEASFPSALQHIGERHMSHTSRLTLWSAIYGLLFNIGAFFGIYMFKRMTTTHLGRKSTFAIAFTLALVATAFTFLFLQNFSDIFWMVPIMGFFQISLFGGYAIYFPELFPTRLRSTGTSFCYNVGRYLAAPGPLLLGVLASQVFGHLGQPLSMRMAGLCMCSFFLIGLIALPFAPETKGKPLPE